MFRTLTALLLLLLVGCRRSQNTPTPTLRIVSTAPNLTECLCAIGATPHLVGRTTACDYPPTAIARVPIIGDYAHPWLEPLLATHPTHVIVSILPDPTIAARLTALDVEVVQIPCNKLVEIPTALRRLGTLTQCQKGAETLAHAIETGLAAAHHHSQTRTSRPRALMLFAPDTPITAGRHAFIATMLELAGAINIGEVSETDFYHISLEWIIQQNPELIICLFDCGTTAPTDLFVQQIGWNKLTAVRTQRVYTVRDLSCVTRPGPRVLEGLNQLREVLQRDAANHPQP